MRPELALSAAAFLCAVGALAISVFCLIKISAKISSEDIEEIESHENIQPARRDWRSEVL